MTRKFSARRVIRRASPLMLLALGLATPATAQVTPELREAIADRGGPREVRSFYALRQQRPLWIVDGAISPAAQHLLDLIASAELDGLDPDDYRPRALLAALERAESGEPKALAKAESLLTQSFLALATDMRRPPDVDVTYPDAVLRPRVPGKRELLFDLAAAPDPARYIDQIGWMNPLYAELRRAAMTGSAPDAADTALVRANLERLRALPADLGKRFVLVDAAAARLWMYEDGRVRDSMRVVVGKASEPTPLMAALIRYASLNPYWNLPPDLARLRAAQGVLENGVGYLKTKRFEVLSDWSDHARPLDPATVDWKAAAEGRMDLRVRQLPGPNNAMGRMKFMFPNDKGVYLHDTPEKNLLKESDRLFSSGCVRLEDAPRLGRWLFGKPLKVAGAKPEQRVDLPQPVPVYIVYRTVAAQGGQLVMRPDVYGRDPGARRELASN